MKPDLKRGDKGGDVEALQDLMNRLGLLLVCDGDFGPGTERAVMECQALAGLPQSGRCDAALWDWLEAQPEPAVGTRSSRTEQATSARSAAGRHSSSGAAH